MGPENTPGCLPLSPVPSLEFHLLP
jgi:hypothetical protein